MSEQSQARMALAMSTFAFAVCFAAWLLYGVLITFLVSRQVFHFDHSQVGWLLGIPILTGSILRLPVGILTDRYGGRAVTTVLMLLSAVPLYLVSTVDSFEGFLLAGLGFGLCGASFASGVAYVSVWFPKERIGTALGVFGAGNAGAALTSVCGPLLLQWLTNGGEDLDGWRNLPRLYGAVLAATAVIFWLSVRTRKVTSTRSATQCLQPLKNIRVWRFGFYYFLMFGSFVALAQWMIPYFVNNYQVSVATAGLLAAVFSFPSGVIRALGGWMSDRWGARTVMYRILGIMVVSCILMGVPRMTIRAAGEGVLAVSGGKVTAVSETAITVEDIEYSLTPHDADGVLDITSGDRSFRLLPSMWQWHEPVVKPGQTVRRQQLLARGVTHIDFQANVWVFTFLLFVVGIAMGIGMAAIYKHIPVYFPDTVGVTGGIVGVLGGLGGVVCPIIFGYLLTTTGLWTSCWVFLAALSLLCLGWMHLVIQRMLQEQAPELAQVIDGRDSTEATS